MLRRALLVGFAFCAATLLFVFSGCTALLGSFDVDTTSAEAGAGALGQKCATNPECTSGNCVDGVCCESACNGVCETCALPTMEGKCLPVPDGEDPQNECPTTPLPDAGTEDAAVELEGDAGDDAGDAGVDDPDAAVVDAGLPFALPEAGVTTEQNQCAGKCNGKRACHYPGAERTCGTVFCGNVAEQGRASCDGKGHCLVGVEKCEAYTCPGGGPGCKKTCTGEADCLPTHFCDAQTSSCKPKLANGSACISVAQCQSGFCVSNVCCNSECNGFPGATCTQPGKVGECQCSACPTGPCQLYYRDEDGDTFGDKYGTIANNRAVPGCVAGPPPAGFVANKLDCFDGPTNAHYNARPNQTGYFSQPYTPPTGTPTFDYDCNETITKETPEFLNSPGCRFCRGALLTCGGQTTCTKVNESAGLGCKLSICKTPCTSCVTNTTTGFTTTVNCGDTRSATDCGYCTLIGGTVTGTTYPQIQQRCR